LSNPARSHGPHSVHGVLPSCSINYKSSTCRSRGTSRRNRLYVQSSAVTAVEVKKLEYNKNMNDQMGWTKDLNPFEYHPERGLYWHSIAPGLICGTQPRSASDVAQLNNEGVTHILNLQQDKDLQYWGVNINDISRRCEELGVTLIRRPARDFDPHSLRKTIPSAVSSVHHAVAQGGRVYVHCTAGLGRAPAVCIAYLYWFMDMDLDSAYKYLTDIRPCGPKRDAIRGATFDLMAGQPFDQFDRLGRDAWASLAPEDKHALQWRVLRTAPPS